METDVERLRSKLAGRLILSCLLGLLPFLILPNADQLIRTVVLPEGTRLQQIVLEKTVLAALVLIAGFVGIGPRRLGMIAPLTGNRSHWIWLIPASFIVLNLSRGEVAFRDTALITSWALRVAIWEEVYYRGIFFAVLRPFGLRTSIVISSVWFGVVHYQSGVPQVLSASVVGLGLANAYGRTGTLLPAVVIHFAINFSSKIVTTTREDFSRDMWMVTILAGVVSVALVLLPGFGTIDSKANED